MLQQTCADTYEDCEVYCLMVYFPQPCPCPVRQQASADVLIGLSRAAELCVVGGSSRMFGLYT